LTAKVNLFQYFENTKCVRSLTQFLGNVVRRFEVSVEAEAITSIRFSPIRNSGLLIAASCDGGISQFKITQGRILCGQAKILIGIGKKAEIAKTIEDGNLIQPLGLDYKGDGSMFAVGRSDGSIVVYDEDTKKMTNHWKAGNLASPGHHNRVFSVKFLPDNPDILVSAGWDGNVFIWDLRDRRCIDYFKSPKVSGDCIDYKAGNILIG
jgi:hypothetical protein